MTFITGMIAFAVISPIQMLMIKAAKGSEMLASSAIQASSNVGNALGAFLGGLPIAAGFSYASPQYVGAGLALAGVGFCAILIFRDNKKVSAGMQSSERPAEVFAGTRIITSKLKRKELEPTID
jgi:DHA1 family arabinose polymer transporter-like MFS transporter